MSAGFRLAGRVFWGTNGAVELCLDTLLAVAALRGLQGSPVGSALAGWREAFFDGAVVDLDEVATDDDARRLLASLFDETLARLSGEGSGLTDHGRAWATSALAELSAALKAPPRALRRMVVRVGAHQSDIDVTLGDEVYYSHSIRVGALGPPGDIVEAVQRALLGTSHMGPLTTVSLEGPRALVAVLEAIVGCDVAWAPAPSTEG